MTATSSDVAKLAGVSRATVSQILNGHADRFAPATAEKVQRAARQLDYRPSVAGRALARGSSDIVIALIPNTTFGANFQDIFEPLTQELAERGLTLVLRFTASAGDSLELVLRSIRPRAVLSLAGFTADERRSLDSHGILAIETPSSNGENTIDRIASTQAQHLFDRGFRQLAFAHLEDQRQELYGQVREAAFRHACRALDLDEPVMISVDLTLESASRALGALPGTGYAVACYNDDVGTALLAAAHRHGWSVPGDVAVIGLDHTPLSQLTHPPLTTIEYDLESVTRSTTGWALAVLDGHSDSSGIHPVELRVVQGGST